MTTNETKRLELHEKLVAILGSRNVYYQPPETLKIKYPAIIYKKSQIDTRFADNTRYINHTGYQVTIVDEDPDSEITERMLDFPLASFSSHYAYGNLNHDVFQIFY